MCRLSVNTSREVAIRISCYQRVKKGYGVVGLSFHGEADRWLLTIKVLQENVNFVSTQDGTGVIHIGTPSPDEDQQYSGRNVAIHIFVTQS